MPPTPRPLNPTAPVERHATCLETDEDVLNALRANLGTPPSAPVAPPAVPFAASPSPKAAIPQQPPARPAGPQPWSVTPYRPTLRPPMAVLTVFDDGKGDGEQVRLRDNRFVIGRTEGDLVILGETLFANAGCLDLPPDRDRQTRRLLMIRIVSAARPSASCCNT